MTTSSSASTSAPGSPVERLGASRYVLLTTFRRDGRAVPTPVWVMRDGDCLAVWSAADAGKVKRIRNSGRVTVAPCDWRGTPMGEPVPGVADLPAAEDTVHYLDLMKRKYGLVARLGLLGSRLKGAGHRTVGIRIRLLE
ncbi:PPOX class F420-dependent oxidoreductase [Streptomyces sp. TRM66268-LWL]|uniref:PPOX class F420-dependent oxidoreductase n=1 Tax=Streptomyces polyasparticus TaxID=2767826 RepID=A0ABR7SH57_9ACTN|nr:PPOX class F420-dependent oxidoreductase [Streptomyces polyasparticus]MBC9714840.1 PPOX class F420-dependent oxidoreductase [Streptomyces polyasparticus]